MGAHRILARLARASLCAATTFLPIVLACSSPSRGSLSGASSYDDDEGGSTGGLDSDATTGDSSRSGSGGSGSSGGIQQRGERQLRHGLERSLPPRGRILGTVRLRTELVRSPRVHGLRAPGRRTRCGDVRPRRHLDLRERCGHVPLRLGRRLRDGRRLLRLVRPRRGDPHDLVSRGRLPRDPPALRDGQSVPALQGKHRVRRRVLHEAELQRQRRPVLCAQRFLHRVALTRPRSPRPEVVTAVEVEPWPRQAILVRPTREPAAPLHGPC